MSVMASSREQSQRSLKKTSYTGGIIRWWPVFTHVSSSYTHNAPPAIPPPLPRLIVTRGRPAGKSLCNVCDVTALPHSPISATTVLLSHENLTGPPPLTFHPPVEPTRVNSASPPCSLLTHSRLHLPSALQIWWFYASFISQPGLFCPSIHCYKLYL